MNKIEDQKINKEEFKDKKEIKITKDITESKKNKKTKKVKETKEKKHGFLLFKNSIKQALRNKIQLIGLAVLVLLSSTIFSLMQTSLTRVNNVYESLISEEQSNIHDFIFDPYNTAKLNNDLPQPDHPVHPDDDAATVEDQQLYLNELADVKGNEFIWDRVEARTLQVDNNNDPKILKLISYNKDARIDKLVVTHGFNIGENPNEVVSAIKQTVINKEFADKNKLKIGDVIRVQLDNKGDTLKVEYDITDPKYQDYNWLKIVGFGVSADFITPIIDQSTPIPNKLKEGIIYVEPTKFGFASRWPLNNNFLWFHNKAKDLMGTASSTDTEIYYVGKSTMKQKNNLTAISDFFKARYINNGDSSANLVYGRGDSGYRFNNRTNTLPTTLEGFTALLVALLLIVLIITGITVVLITFKNIDNAKPQIGILKSLGYSNWRILITSLAYPMLAAFIGTLLVFLPASGLQVLVVGAFANYFNLNFGQFMINGLGYVYCLLLTFGFLSIIAWIISSLTVIKNPIVLIKNISVTRDSKFTKFVKKTSSNAKFLTRFRLALFTSSIGKMMAVFLTMFLGTVLMTSAIIGPKIMADNERSNYTGMNYKSLTEYVNPTYNSPFTFYKTYNPNNQPWGYTIEDYGQDETYKHPDRNNEKFAEDLLNNSINSEAYAPIAADPSEPSALMNLSLYSLTHLYGKMFTKDFLEGLDNSNANLDFIIDSIIDLAWPEVKATNTIANSNSIYSPENYQILRKFYFAYRSTIIMTLNPKVHADNNENQFDKDNFKKFVNEKNITSWKSDEDGFNKELNNFEFDKSETKYPWHIINENELFENANPDPGSDLEKQWIRKILIWYDALFYNQIGQIITQGTYTKSPYFIKQNLATAFEESDGKFNISFNVIPYDKDTDELGTYFVGTPDIKFKNKSYPMKVYGLENEKTLGKNSLMQLYDRNGHSLNSSLERNNDDGAINIVINQTIAKQLGMKENQTFLMSPNGNVLKTNQDPEHPNQYTPIELNKINFSALNNMTDDETSVSPGENNVTLLNQNTKYQQIPSTVENGAYPNFGNTATAMLQEVSQGNVINDIDTTLAKFKVSGIYNGYGEPAAYIAKDHADHLLKFDQAKKALYEIFKHEWQTKDTVSGIDFGYLNEHSYEQFIDNKDDPNPQLKTIFNNEFPIFNFKFSGSEKLIDSVETFSVSQAYGDYSAVGMNGGLGTNTGKNYDGYGEGTAVNILPLYVHKQLLEQITELVNTVLLFFIIFSLIISFFIILLTSNLVIYENRNIIATMKTLGYSDAKITNIVIGMYMPIILVTWLIGVPIGWLIVQAITNYLAFNTAWVLPLLFAWWLPIAIGLIVISIYAITFIIEWQTMKKLKPLTILNETN